MTTQLPLIPPPPASTGLLARLRTVRVYRPYTLVISVLLLLPGSLALIYGDGVSRALSIIVADVVSRTMGGLLLTGSVLTLTGLLWRRSLWEIAGLVLTAAGCGIYSVGVVLGLGLQGTMAGSGFFAIAAASMMRVATLSLLAKENSDTS